MLIEVIQRWGEASFQPPAAADAVRACEAQLGHKVPDQLRRLLAETDGIEGDYGLGLLWTTRRIAEDNSAFRRNPDFRRLYMPFTEISIWRATLLSAPMRFTLCVTVESSILSSSCLTLDWLLQAPDHRPLTTGRCA